MKSRLLHHLNSITFKKYFTLFLIIYLLVIFNIVLKRPNVTDPLPQFKAITTEVIKQLGPFCVRVKTGMFIKGFPIFDVNKNTFLIDAIIWFEFNGDEIMQEKIEKFSIDNGKIISISPSDIKKVSENNIFAKYNVVFELKTDLNFHKYPFEDHKLPIVISNDFFTPNEMIFTVDASSFQIQPNIRPAGWIIRDTSVDAGFLPLQLDKQDVTKKAENPKAIFYVNFIKSSARKALVIFLPLFAAAFFSLLSFIMNAANIVGKFSLAITAVTALLGYRFVIEQMMPLVGYFTTTDAIYLFLLFFTFINFAIQLLLTRRYMVEAIDTNKEKIIASIEKLNSAWFIIMSLLLGIITTYIIFT